MNCIPENMITPEMCLIAVKQNGQALYFISNNMITPEMCLIAVKKNYRNLIYVPFNLITHEICLITIAQNGICLSLLIIPSAEYITCKAL